MARKRGEVRRWGAARGGQVMVRGYLTATLVGLALLLPAPVHAVVPGVNGKIVFVSSRDGNDEIYIMNSDGSALTRLTNNPADDRYPVLSPDGSKIAFASNRASSYEIYTMKSDGTNVTRLTTNAFLDFHPAWSPDGSKIAFDTDRDGNTEIYTMNADGTGQTNRTNNPGFDQDPDWSPDGTKIAFESSRTGNYEIYSMNADGTGVTNLTNYPDPDLQPAWSPDGTKIAFVSQREDNPIEVYTMNANGSNPTRLTNNIANDFFPDWSPDGTKILFTSGRDVNDEVYMMNTDGSNQNNRTNNVAMDSEQDWAPLRAPFDAPTGASPLTVSLVPFFRQTISATQCAARGGQASTHGPPLSLTSCNPPGFTPGTIAKFGEQATGSAQIAIVPGDLTTTADEADVSLTVNLSDVHSGSATGVDYDPNPSGADASLIFLFRLTDTLNGPASSTPATVTDSTISTPVTCTATAGSLGSNCAAATTADAVMPGFVKEGKSMSIQVFGVRLLDSGSNGVRGDSDDKLFAFQGVYVP